jgi:serine protease
MPRGAGRSPFLRIAAAVAIATVAGGCGGGGGGGDDGGGNGGGGGATLSGTIRASSSDAADGDTNDSTRPKVSNDTFERAQAVPSAVTVGGYARAATDPVDLYRAQLAAGQTVTLELADWSGGAVDLDLCIFAVADTVNPVDCLVDTVASETLTVAVGGEYFVGIEAVQGGSNYLLRLGQPVSAAGPSTSTLRTSAEFVPGEVVVRFRPGTLRLERGAAGADTVAARAASVGLAAKAGVSGSAMLLDLGDEAQREKAFRALAIEGRRSLAFGAAARDPALGRRLDTLRVVKALRRRADVETADPNYVRRAFRVPSDALYKYQWHYPLIRLPQAWDVTNPGSGTPALADVTVAIVDSGVFLAHPDLSAKLVGGYDFVSNAAESNDGDGIDANADDPGDSLTPGGSSWHGTHVAGTVAATSDDALGVAGVAWGARIMPVRVLGRGGSGTSFDTIQGIRWAARLSNTSNTVPPRRADVVNLSLGGPGSSGTEAAEFAAVRAAGVIVVAAAGNENTSVPSFPASYDGVVSVSAVDLARQRAPYSNTGATVDVAAPGGDVGSDRDGNGIPDGVVSSFVDDSAGTREPSAAALQGTSMAAPHVAGVVALMKTVCPSLTPDQLDSLLASDALTQDLGTPGRDDQFGHGLVDALAAVQAAGTSCGVAPAPFIRVDPTRLDLGPADATATLQVSAGGTGAIGVAIPTADVPWLAVAPASVDANGIGTYTVTVNREGLAPGSLGGRITVTPTAGSPVIVPVTLQVGAATGGAGDAGRLYVLLVNAQLEPVDQAVADAASGAYSYSFANVPAGTYFVVAGSDADDDGTICDAGEACGAYPTLGRPASVTVGATRGGLDFPVAFQSELGTSALAAPPAKALGPLRRLPAPKKLEARR